MPIYVDAGLFPSNVTSNSARGIAFSATAYENLFFGDVCIITSNGVAKADADSIDTAGVLGIALHDAAADENVNLLVWGMIDLSSLSPSFTVGGKVYLSTTAGAVTQTAPSGALDAIVVLGIALSANLLLFNPSLVVIEHV
jgi:hypothetical protein